MFMIKIRINPNEFDWRLRPRCRTRRSLIATNTQQTDTTGSSSQYANTVTAQSDAFDKMANYFDLKSSNGRTQTTNVSSFR